jgi:hypothetical protein
VVIGGGEGVGRRRVDAMTSIIDGAHTGEIGIGIYKLNQWDK